MAKNLSLAVLLLLGLVKADQPVSCLGQAAGAWNFHMSADAQTVDLFQTQEVCTHQMPNKLQILTQNQDFSFASEQVMQVQLNEDGTAKAQKCGKFAGGECKASDGEEIAGTWVAFYDQAFKVELDNGPELLATSGGDGVVRVFSVGRGCQKHQLSGEEDIFESGMKDLVNL